MSLVEYQSARDERIARVLKDIYKTTPQDALAAPLHVIPTPDDTGRRYVFIERDQHRAALVVAADGAILALRPASDVLRTLWIAAPETAISLAKALGETPRPPVIQAIFSPDHVANIVHPHHVQVTRDATGALWTIYRSYPDRVTVMHDDEHVATLAHDTDFWEWDDCSLPEAVAALCEVVA